MSFVEMNMFAPRIWGFDAADTEMRMALAAGWSRADLVWERLTEAGFAAFDTGDLGRAARLLSAAGWTARLFFAADDLRRATSCANLASIALAQGRAARAQALQKRALTLWQPARDSIDQLEFRPRSRSSLFHLRMEALHRETFHDNIRQRYRNIAAETEQALRGLLTGHKGTRPMYARWRGEKPPVFDDSRRFLAAALALIDG